MKIAKEQAYTNGENETTLKNVRIESGHIIRIMFVTEWNRFKLGGHNFSFKLCNKGGSSSFDKEEFV